MKLDGRRLEAFLDAPGAVRAVLLYGEDGGLVRERAIRLVVAVVGRSDDPFQVVELDRATIDALPAEAAALPLTGGRRVIRVREAGDFVTESLRRTLAGPGDGLVVLEAGILPARSKLRVLAEDSGSCAVIACYPVEGAAREAFIRSVLTSRGVAVDAEAAGWLARQLDGDRLAVRGEIEKLALYAGDGGTVDLATARASVGDLAAVTLDDAVFAATAGDVAGVDRHVGAALSEGAQPIQMLRAGLSHLHRLRQARVLHDDGTSVGDAVKRLRPPVFFRRVGAFTTAVSLWSANALAAAAQSIAAAERACKRSGAPAEEIARQALLGIAVRAGARRRQ